jgi:hypothetical protein
VHGTTDAVEVFVGSSAESIILVTTYRRCG